MKYNGRELASCWKPISQLPLDRPTTALVQMQNGEFGQGDLICPSEEAKAKLGLPLIAWREHTNNESPVFWREVEN